MYELTVSLEAVFKGEFLPDSVLGEFWLVVPQENLEHAHNVGLHLVEILSWQWTKIGAILHRDLL